MNPKPKLSRDDLTALDLRVMEALTTSRVTTTTVGLASTMWEGWSDQLGADPVGLVEYLVQGLAERGLVNYVLVAKRPGIHDPYAGLPRNIRLSKDGWALMGYPNRAYQVGTRQATDIFLDHKGDRTNFRKHSTTAEGVGPIEVDTFAEHRWKFPTHIHMYGDDMDITSARPDLAPVEVDGEGKPRGYVRVTPELEAKVMAVRSVYPTHSYTDISDMVGLPERTIKYILTDLPRLRAQNDADPVKGSLKERIVWTLEAIPVVKSVRELRMVLGRADTEHDIVHVLHSLHTEGKVDFREAKAGNSPTNIALTARGRGKGLPKTVAERIPEQVADRILPEEVQPADAAAEADHEPPVDVPATYPLLDALIEREGKRLNADNKAMNYLAAAELVKDTDPEMYSTLVSKAEANDIPFPSPLEAEYLRYVAEKGARG
jgi:hypothetical protein